MLYSLFLHCLHWRCISRLAFTTVEYCNVSVIRAILIASQTIDNFCQFGYSRNEKKRLLLVHSDAAIGERSWIFDVCEDLVGVINLKTKTTVSVHHITSDQVTQAPISSVVCEWSAHTTMLLVEEYTHEALAILVAIQESRTIVSVTNYFRLKSGSFWRFVCTLHFQSR